MAATAMMSWIKPVSLQFSNSFVTCTEAASKERSWLSVDAIAMTLARLSCYYGMATPLEEYWRIHKNLDLYDFGYAGLSEIYLEFRKGVRSGVL